MGIWLRTFCALILTFATSTVLAQTQWVGNSTGDWDVAADWDNGVPDAAGNNPTIDLSDTGSGSAGNIAIALPAVDGLLTLDLTIAGSNSYATQFTSPDSKAYAVTVLTFSNAATALNLNLGNGGVFSIGAPNAATPGTDGIVANVATTINLTTAQGEATYFGLGCNEQITGGVGNLTFLTNLTGGQGAAEIFICGNNDLNGTKFGTAGSPVDTLLIGGALAFGANNVTNFGTSYIRDLRVDGQASVDSFANVTVTEVLTINGAVIETDLSGLDLSGVNADFQIRGFDETEHIFILDGREDLITQGTHGVPDTAANYIPGADALWFDGTIGAAGNKNRLIIGYGDGSANRWITATLSGTINAGIIEVRGGSTLNARGATVNATGLNLWTNSTATFTDDTLTFTESSILNTGSTFAFANPGNAQTLTFGGTSNTIKSAIDLAGGNDTLTFNSTINSITTPIDLGADTDTLNFGGSVAATPTLLTSFTNYEILNIQQNATMNIVAGQTCAPAGLTTFAVKDSGKLNIILSDADFTAATTKLTATNINGLTTSNLVVNANAVTSTSDGKTVTVLDGNLAGSSLASWSDVETLFYKLDYSYAVNTGLSVTYAVKNTASLEQQVAAGANGKAALAILTDPAPTGDTATMLDLMRSQATSINDLNEMAQAFTPSQAFAMANAISQANSLMLQQFDTRISNILGFGMGGMAMGNNNGWRGNGGYVHNPTTAFTYNGAVCNSGYGYARGRNSNPGYTNHRNFSYSGYAHQPRRAYQPTHGYRESYCPPPEVRHLPQPRPRYATGSYCPTTVCDTPCEVVTQDVPVPCEEVVSCEATTCGTSASCLYGYNVWGQFYGYDATQGGKNGYLGYQSDGWGVTAGGDKTFGHLIAGAGFGYSENKLNSNVGSVAGFPAAPNYADIKTYSGILYSVYNFTPRFFATAMFGYTWAEVDGTRNNFVGPVTYKTSTGTFLTQCGMGYKWVDNHHCLVAPRVRYSYFSYNQNGYTEVGGATVAQYEHGYSQLDGLFDIRANCNSWLSLISTLGYRYVVDAEGVLAGVQQNGLSYNVQGIAPAENIFLCDAGVLLHLGCNVSLVGQFNMQLGDGDYQLYGGTAAMTVQF